MQINREHINQIFITLGDIMVENKNYLTELDAAIGDGDLGLTMSKGFSELASIVTDIHEEDLGKLLFKLGSNLANTVPSTMGTLMASGLMKAGKALKGNNSFNDEEMAAFFDNFVIGVMERGKGKPGDKTVIDSLYPASESLKESVFEGKDLRISINEAYKASVDGLESTINMTSTHGKAAVFQEKSVGKQDPGATVGKLFVEGFYKVIATL
ncbi:dihydroxyacetone kinase subunit DhaL [Mycoplasmatota bacterium zrk1]